MLKKYYLGIFFLAPILYKWYPNTSEFASDPPSTIVSAYDSHSIQPLAETFPSYIRNRKPFLQLLESLTPFPDTTIMVTTNATSLGIKMLHAEDIYYTISNCNMKPYPKVPLATIKLTYYLKSP